MAKKKVCRTELVEGEAAIALSQDAWHFYEEKQSVKGVAATPKFSTLIVHLRRSRFVTQEEADHIIARMQNGASIEDAFYAEYAANYKQRLGDFESEYPAAKRWRSQFGGGSVKASSKSLMPASIKLDIHEIAKKLELPEFSDFEENNNEYVWEAGNAYHQQAIADGLSEDEAEAKRTKGEDEAGLELWRNWTGAVMRAAEEIWGFHHLRLDESSNDPAYHVGPKPGKTWHDVAHEIAITINGVGMVEVPAEDYARAPRKWVLEHLGAMKYQPDVYGTASAQRIYEGSFR